MSQLLVALGGASAASGNVRDEQADRAQTYMAVKDMASPDRLARGHPAPPPGTSVALKRARV